MDMSYQEKSVLGSLVVTVFVFLYYCSRIYDIAVGSAELTIGGLWPLVLSITLAVVVVEFVGHIITASVAGSEEKDERDTLIDVMASRIAYLVLGIGTFVAVFHLILTTMMGIVYANPLLRDFWIVNLLIFALTLAEVVKFSARLIYYRRGLQA